MVRGGPFFKKQTYYTWQPETASQVASERKAWSLRRQPFFSQYIETYGKKNSKAWRLKYRSKVHIQWHTSRSNINQNMLEPGVWTTNCREHLVLLCLDGFGLSFLSQEVSNMFIKDLIEHKMGKNAHTSNLLNHSETQLLAIDFFLKSTCDSVDKCLLPGFTG